MTATDDSSRHARRIGLRSASRTGAMTLCRASPCWRPIDLPRADTARHPVATALPVDVERKLAELVGIEPVVDEPSTTPIRRSTRRTTRPRPPTSRKRVLRVAEQVTVGSLLLLVGCAVAAARINSTSLRVHSIPLTFWAIAAAMAAVGLAALVTDPDVVDGLSRGQAPRPRRALDGGAAGLGHRGRRQRRRRRRSRVGAVPAGRRGGGRGARAGRAACWSARSPPAASTRRPASRTPSTSPGVGRLVVILPACPLFGWAAGALASSAHDAVATAREQRLALVRRRRRGSARCSTRSAAGDLSRGAVAGQPGRPGHGHASPSSSPTPCCRCGGWSASSAASPISCPATPTSSPTPRRPTSRAVEQQASAVAETTSTIEQLAATATTISEHRRAGRDLRGYDPARRRPRCDERRDVDRVDGRDRRAGRGARRRGPAGSTSGSPRSPR